MPDQFAERSRAIMHRVPGWPRRHEGIRSFAYDLGGYINPCMVYLGHAGMNCADGGISAQN
jgi:hypothetical protein